MAAAEIKLSADKASRAVKVGNIENSEEKDAVDFFKKMSETALFDTGVLPLEGTGVLAIRQALNHTQIVFQHEPGAYLVNWGTYEGDKNAKTYELAQPYRIVIGDIVDGNLLGARTFFSPLPILTPDAPLYHVNLPNINCRGYRGNGVGWICLYRTQNWTQYNLAQKIRKLVERASGVETYNDANMSSTDGARFYQKAGKPKYTWDPGTIQQKTQSEGFAWTIEEEDLWIPILVGGPDNQDKHYPNGTPLTLDMAMKGRYASYYSDQYLPKPVNAFMNPTEKEPDGATIQQHLGNAFAKSASVGSVTKKVVKKDGPIIEPEPQAGAGNVWAQAAPVFAPPPVKCGCCGKVIENGNDAANFKMTQDGKSCLTCYEHCYVACKVCKKMTHYDVIQCWGGKEKEEGTEYFCFECATVYSCPNCEEKAINNAEFIVDSQWCIKCAKVGTCSKCDKRTNMNACHGVEARVPWADKPMTFQLCLECVGSSAICACGFLRDDDECAPLGDGSQVCAPCVAYKDDDTPFYQPVNISVSITGNGEPPEEENVLWANAIVVE